MRKFISAFLIIFLGLSSLATAAEEGSNALLIKMQRQLQVGSGLTGSFVIHGSTDSEKYPLVSSLLDSEFQFRSIRSGDQLHAVIFQPGNNDTMAAKNEVYQEGKKTYFRSDMLKAESYLLPDLAHVVDSFLHAEGENPSVLVDLLELLLGGKTENNEAINTEQLEKEIGNWINLFPSERSIRRGEGITPQLTQEYRIPAESMFKTVNELIGLISKSESAMKILRSFLTGEQISTYFNPDLAYYYTEAMQQLDLKGDIIYSRTVSTMGEVLMNTLSLPIPESKTGFSSVAIQSDDSTTSIILNGSEKTCYLEVPAGFNPYDAEYDASFRFILIHAPEKGKDNYSVRIHAVKSHTVYTDPEDDTTTHETDHYMFRLSSDTEKLPDAVSGSEINEFKDAGIELDLHFSSKMKPSSRTYLEVNFKAEQGIYNLEMTGTMNSEVPWTFAPFNPGNAADLAAFQADDWTALKMEWIRNAESLLTHTPKEILPTEAEHGNVDENPEASSQDMPDVPETEAVYETDDEAVPLSQES